MDFSGRADKLTIRFNEIVDYYVKRRG